MLRNKVQAFVVLLAAIGAVLVQRALITLALQWAIEGTFARHAPFLPLFVLLLFLPVNGRARRGENSEKGGKESA